MSSTLQKVIFYNLLLVFSIQISYAQVKLRENPDLEDEVKKTVDFIYNYEFERADTEIARLKTTLKDHPVYPLLKSLILYFQLSEEKDENMEEQYIKYLEHAVVLAEAMIDVEKNEPEAVFFSFSAYGYLGQFYGEKGNYLKALGYAKKMYRYLKKGLDMKDDYNEFYFSSGVYHYYAEQYPETHPAVKPFMMFFSPGDREQGLKELRKASRVSKFSETESKFYLGYIYMKYENRPELALKYFRDLHKDFPKNNYYHMLFIETLFNNKKYDNAKEEIGNLHPKESKIQKLATKLFSGWYAEYEEEDYDTAMAFYQQGIDMGKFNHASANYLSLCYAGKARVLDHYGKTEEAEDVYKKVLDLTEYENVKKEAKAYIKSH